MTERVEQGTKEAGRTSGAPYPPAPPEKHDDTQNRPRRDVPTAPAEHDDEEGTDAD